MLHFSGMRCSRCSHPYDMHFVLGTTGLGPELIVCRLCQTPLHTGRHEWAQFPVGRRFEYGLRTIFYAALIGFAFGHVTFTSYYGLEDMQHLDLAAFLYDPPFFIVSLSAAFLVVALQILRVDRSLRRSENPRAHRPAFILWDLDFALQAKALLLLLLSIFAAISLGKFLRDGETRGPRIRDGVAQIFAAPHYRLSSESSEKSW